MEKGPFIKDHEFFLLAKTLPESKTALGFTYETWDAYAAVWFRTVKEANDFRVAVNQSVGWSIASKPDVVNKSDELNPWTIDAAYVSILPKETADRNDKHGGDALVGALAACVEAGAEIKI